MSATRRAATLPVSFFERSADVVARELLGTTVVSTLGGARTAGRIVEAEAYLGCDDPASHGYRDRRHAQNEALFGPPGTLVRLPVVRHALVRQPGVRRRRATRAPCSCAHSSRSRDSRPCASAGSGVADRQLCSGPGKLCQALGDHARPRRAARCALGRTWSVRTAEPPAEIVVTPRIGITKAADWPLRFVVEGSPWVSRGALGRSDGLRRPMQSEAGGGS